MRRPRRRYANAGADDADMIIAVTQSDQSNLVACKLAHSVFNVPTRIARLRSRDFLEDESLLSPENFAVDFALCPEQVITDYIRRLIEFPEALCRCSTSPTIGSVWSQSRPSRVACW